MTKEGHLALHLQVQLDRRELAARVSLEDCSLVASLHVGYGVLKLP